MGRSPKSFASPRSPRGASPPQPCSLRRRMRRSDFPTVDPVLQHQIEGATGQALTAGQPSAGALKPLAHNALPVEFGIEQGDRAQFGIALEDRPDSRGLGLVDGQLPLLNGVAERHIAAHPHRDAPAGPHSWASLARPKQVCRFTLLPLPTTSGVPSVRKIRSLNREASTRRFKQSLINSSKPPTVLTAHKSH
jgi:hypothetical protein